MKHNATTFRLIFPFYFLAVTSVSDWVSESESEIAIASTKLASLFLNILVDDLYTDKETLKNGIFLIFLFP